MAQNPRFNNSDMFNNSNDYSDITPDSTSEVLATQGNVINSIKVFWNKLRAKLAYAVTRGNTTDSVGSNWCPIYVDANGEVKECNATMLTVSILGDGNIPYTSVNDITTPHTGTTAYLNISSNNATADSNTIKINNKVVKFVSGVEVKAGDISNGDKLVLTYAKDSDSAGFWLLLNKINTVSAANAITTSNDTTPNGSAGLMSVRDKAKLDGIAFGANKYSLPAATDSSLGGVQLGYTTNETSRNYKLQTDKDGNGYVNVPWTDTHEANWTADLKVGTASSTGNDTTSGTQETYIKVVENGAVHGKVKVVGSGSVEVSSSSNGELEIYGAPTSYNRLAEEDRSSSKNYVIRGIGDTIPNPTNYYLRGNGTWGAPVASMGSMSASISNGTTDNEGHLISGTLTVTYNGSPIQFVLLHGSTYVISGSNGTLSLLGTTLKVGALGAETTALIIPIGYLSLKPQILYFNSLTTVSFLDT